VPASSNDVDLQREVAKLREPAKPTRTDTAQAIAAASLMSQGIGVIDSPRHHAVAFPSPGKDSHIAVDSGDSVNKVKAAVKAGFEQMLVSSSSVHPHMVAPAPTPKKIELSTSQGNQAKPGLDKSKISVLPDSLVAPPRNVEVTGGTKAQPHKDDSASSTNSQAADQGGGAAPARPLEPAGFQSMVGTQALAAASDGRHASTAIAQETNLHIGQLDQKATGVADVHSHLEPTPAHPTPLIHTAKLVSRIGETGLRLGIRAGEFGSVDIRTSMARNQFTAEISTERGDLGRALAAELPSLQDRLTEQRVPVANITVQDHSAGNSTASEQQKPRDGQPLYVTSPVNRTTGSPMPAVVTWEATTPASRLDIHM
jgi:flagellar hook-length control protein FliK